MILFITRLLVVGAGFVIGYMQISPDAKGVLIGTAAGLFVIGVEYFISRVSLDALISAVIGAVLGLLFAHLAKWVVFQMDYPQWYEMVNRYSLLLYLVCSWLGLIILVRKRGELDLLDRDLIVKDTRKKMSSAHLVDTSVLIDGRIAEVVETKFLNGSLVVARFILQELQQVADSSDPARRARGRRGLEILERLQKVREVPLKIFDKDFPDEKAVDAKLVRLARELGAKVLTTDFNLNKIASLQGVTVLNVNDLSNALKPIVLPGEPMGLYILKEGKEKEQGVGYLDDGTMVVVTDGRRQVGQRVSVVVTSILQTSAGRMIFARLKEGMTPPPPAAETTA